jgi:hypothetical protein
MQDCSRNPRYAAHPTPVCIRFVNGVLTVSKHIPGARKDLSLEWNAAYILDVSCNMPSSRTCIEIPQSEGYVPGVGQRELVI